MSSIILFRDFAKEVGIIFSLGQKSTDRFLVFDVAFDHLDLAAQGFVNLDLV